MFAALHCFSFQGFKKRIASNHHFLLPLALISFSPDSLNFFSNPISFQQHLRSSHTKHTPQHKIFHRHPLTRGSRPMLVASNFKNCLTNSSTLRSLSQSYFLCHASQITNLSLCRNVEKFSIDLNSISCSTRCKNLLHASISYNLQYT